ncbi:RHD protein, partial [Corythaeola cristata]|nr:RHD protein [Corythaeola cristata]
FQDISHMVIFGFFFFLTFLKRYGFSSIGFNLFFIVLGVQCSVLIEDLLVFFFLLAEEAIVSTTAVVISTGAVLGKTNPVQLILMTVVEIIVFRMSKWINNTVLQIPDDISMMHVHLFGAYFGLTFSSRFSEPSPRSEKNASTPKSHLLSFFCTLFLWMFWPSFNSVLAENKSNAIYSTYFALAVSAVTAFVFSVLTTKDGKFRMVRHERKITAWRRYFSVTFILAGGVTVGFAFFSIKHPWIAMILGLLASVITVLGSDCLQRCLNPALKLHDTSGIHFTFGLPGVLGGLAQVVLLVIETKTFFLSPGYLVMFHIGAFFLTISVAVITGFVTGLILNLKLFKTPPVSKYFEDQFYWEVSF